MQLLALLSLTLCVLQTWPAVFGDLQHQPFVVLGNNWPRKLSKAQNFAWENCGPSSEPAVLKSLSISPDPLTIPGDVAISASGATTINLVSPLKTNVTLEKRLGELWIKIPCIDDLGSCVYDDICAKLDLLVPPGQQCPEPLESVGIPCHCPFKAGSYNLPPSEFFIPNIGLPSFLTNGDYKIKAVLSNGDQELSCVKLSFSLHTENLWF